MRFRRVLRKLVLLTLPCLLLILLVVEGLLRLFGYTPYYLENEAFIPSRNPEILYELRPGFKGLYARVPIAINSSGFRGKEWAPDGNLARLRIVVLGDSIAFGQGVQENETLAEQLETRLRLKRSAPVEVMNLGVPGYNTCQEYWTFKERVLPLRARVVLLLYVDNDTDPPVFQVDGDRVISPDLRTGWFGDLMGTARKHSRLYNLAWVRWQALKHPVFSIDRYRDILSRKFSNNDPGWQTSRDYLTRMAELARQNAIRLVIIPMPVLWGLTDQPYPFDAYLQTVSRMARDAGAESFDVLPLLQDPALRARVSSDDRHPSAEVFSRMADRLAEILP
jgi:hypothetical protein